MNLNLERIVAVTGGAVLNRAADTFTSYAIDSRKIKPGGLFFAIPGAVTDGHLFVEAAAANGAAGAVVQKPVEARASQTIVRVADSMAALQQLAADVRTASTARFIGLTGSAGKTSTKEFVAALLARKYRVYKSEGNLNSITGMPLSLLAMENPECAVFEVGMSEPGEIASLVALLRPHVRILLNVNPVHLGQFPSIDAIADEKCSLLRGALPTDVAVYNSDDARLVERVFRFAGPKVSFGFNGAPDVRIADVESRGVMGQRATLIHEGVAHAFETSLCGRGNLYNIAAAAGTAVVCGVSWTEIVAGIRELKPYQQRGILSRVNGFDVYDDSYNSNPAALSFALDLMSESEGYKRKVAVLGDMLELGPEENEFHAEAGRKAASAGLDVLITCGPRSRFMADAARAGGVKHVHAAENSQQAAEIAVKIAEPGDLVLVKGSRGMKTEVVVEALRKK